MRVIYKGKLWDKEAVQNLLANNPDAVANAVRVVYRNQTEDEVTRGETVHHNGIGFTGRDANFLTDIAKKYEKWGRWASDRQLSAVRKTMMKYHGQLLADIAKRDGAVVIKGRMTADHEALINQQRDPAPAPKPVVEPAATGSW